MTRPRSSRDPSWPGLRTVPASRAGSAEDDTDDAGASGENVGELRRGLGKFVHGAAPVIQVGAGRATAEAIGSTS